MSDQDERRRTLAEFLRSRRARVRPETVGLPPGTHRRLGGLRREEVAILAGVSPTWYTYLEQGRKIQPSAEVLDSLARVLGLTEDERRYVHILAYGKVLRPEPLEAESPAEDLLGEIVALSDGNPYPVYCTDRYGDLIAWNTAATIWYDDWGLLAPNERNMLHWLLGSPAAQDRLADWESDTQDVVARCRAEVARRPDDQKLQQKIREYRQISSQFAIWWNDHEVRETRSRSRRFQHPILGLKTLQIVPLQSVHDASTGIVFHLPSPDASD